MTSYRTYKAAAWFTLLTMSTLAQAGARDSLPDEYFNGMRMYGISETTAKSLLANEIDESRLVRIAEFTIGSSEIDYIDRVRKRLVELEGAGDCRLGKSLRWIIDLSRTDTGESRRYVGDGKVVVGPNGFCKTAAGIRSFDVTEDFLSGSKYEVIH